MAKKPEIVDVDRGTFRVLKPSDITYGKEVSTEERNSEVKGQANWASVKSRQALGSVITLTPDELNDLIKSTIKSAGNQKSTEIKLGGK